MAQALVETIFDICYLVGVIAAGIVMMTKGRSNPLVKKFGLMAVLLGAGDSFHLVPRMFALWTTGLEANAAALGIGKLITSITMTVFYLIFTTSGVSGTTSRAIKGSPPSCGGLPHCEFPCACFRKMTGWPSGSRFSGASCAIYPSPSWVS